MPKRKSTGLSKSLILKGIQCRKALWLSKNPPDFELPPRPELEAKFAAGTEVGILAQQLFPGGTEVPFEGLPFPVQLARTKQLIERGADVIYEASFSRGGIFVKVDLLVRDLRSWRIYEVKMGTSVKEVNFDDVAVQHYVLTGCGLDISRSFLVHIDNSYVRQGDIEVGRLFHGEDITAEVLARQAAMPELVEQLRDTLREDGEPAIDIGPWCVNPYECDFIPYCWRHVPEDSIFDLRGKGLDKFACYREGKVRLADLDCDELNDAQRFQAEATLERRDVTDVAAIRDFLDTLWYPLCHLDFETFDTPIPPFDGTRPYQKIPFQYSLHIQQCEGAEPEHFEYLAEPHIDPRRELAEKLLREIPAGACVLTYNMAFEKSVLRELAELFPDLADALLQRVDNVRDLMLPFKKRHLYRWPMRGSYSIKAVLPALAPDLSYQGLGVADGQMARLAYREMCTTEDPARLAEIRRDLL
ncbi:DUF2779 domain-containing protein, partial [Trichloromonas sp.]|uniref:DUF2779 domain-containing protein n=1 Tax=Trichloromonas sp. TaxID=3069249 RepID=UPI003D816AFD